MLSIQTSERSEIAKYLVHQMMYYCTQFETIKGIIFTTDRKSERSERVISEGK